MTVRKESLTVSTEDFAANRRKVLEEADNRIREAVRGSLIRYGLPQWEEQAVEAALTIFDETVLTESDETSPVVEDMRSEFAREVRDSLRQTTQMNTREAQDRQIETITRWLSTMAVNAGTEAATTTDPDERVGLEWVAMADSNVRDIHLEAAGQQVPTGQPFTIDDQYELLYPGQPVGPPKVWINCRCVVRPVMLGEMAAQTVTAAGNEEAKNTSSVIVALPKQGDPVNMASSEDKAHVTLIWLGDASEFDPSKIKESIAAYASTFAPEPFAEDVNGSAVLGADKASVVLFDAKNLVHVREALLQDSNIRDRYEAVEQYPTWIPHLTLGYPDNIQKNDFNEQTVEFDRLALWHGDEQEEYPMAPQVEVGGESEAPPEKKVIHAEDEEFTQEMADAFVASVPAVDEIEEDDAPFDEEAPELNEEDFPPVPWHSVLAPEGTPSGDGRQFAIQALTHRELPLPIKYMPEDADGHDGSYIVGRMDRVFRDGNLVKAEGVFDTSPEAYEVVRKMANEMVRGISVDVDEVVGAEASDEGLMEFSSARIASATICAIPAFAEAYIALGPWEDEEVDEAEEVPEDDAPAQEEKPVDELASEGSWDGSASRFTDEQWHNSCIVHLHDGAPTSKSECKMPIREPGGALSRAGVHAAASRIGQVDAPPEAISKAKASLRSAYKELGEEVPDSLTAAAEAPGVHKDGTPPKCEYCDNPSTQYVLHSEGMAFTPACDEHIEQAKEDAAKSVPGGEPDPSNIVRVAKYGLEEFDIPPRKTKDGPGWITEPKPTKRITAYWVDGPGAAKINWGVPGDFNRCRSNLAKYVQNPEWLAGLCANLHYRALGAWPGQASAKTDKMEDKSMSPAFNLVASAATKTLSADLFRNPMFKMGTPITVTNEGRVFGHLATWDSCHISYADECVTAPTSETDYAYFHTGEVETDAGPVAVGQITMGGGHAPENASLRAAVAHYDSTSTVVADIVVGEDEFGIWCSGVLRDNVDDEKRHALRAAALSGDWRRVRTASGKSNLELVAALAVNVPGFPIPRPSMAASGGHLNTIIAAHIPQKSEDVSIPNMDISSTITASVQAELDRRDRVALAREAKRRFRLEEVRQAKAAFSTEGR